jgi:hypothetical protein
MKRLHRICVAAIAVAALGGPFTSGASVVGASPAEAASEPPYSLYVDFVKLGKLSINASTHECAVEGIIQLVGECSAGSTFSATLHVPSGFLEIGLKAEGLAQRRGRVAYAGLGRLSLEFAGHPPVWVEVRQAL